MKHLILTTALACAGSLALVGCNSDTNVSVNANRGAANANTNAYVNSNSSVMNSAMNTMGNAANTISNTVSNMTGSNDPKDFMTEAAHGGIAEVELGKLTTQKAQNPEVKKFGQMMISDHTAANNDLKTLAAKKNVTLPTEPNSSQNSEKDMLSKLSGAEYDKEYVDYMVDDHEEDVSKFQKQADSSTDPDIKAFAMKTLPVLKKHLEAIKAIQSKMK